MEQGIPVVIFKEFGPSLDGQYLHTPKEYSVRMF